MDKNDVKVNVDVKVDLTSLVNSIWEWIKNLFKKKEK